MIKAISSNVAQYVTVKTLVEALRKLVDTRLVTQLLRVGQRHQVVANCLLGGNRHR
jgi:hypothetical protein